MQCLLNTYSGQISPQMNTVRIKLTLGNLHFMSKAIRSHQWGTDILCNII